MTDREYLAIERANDADWDLQDAQDKITFLESELADTRRLLEESQQALKSLESALGVDVPIIHL